MGLETAHPEVLGKLNKRMTLAQYAEAAAKLRGWGVALRSFVLLQPPFMGPEQAVMWACRSIDFAQECGATAVTVIPTRGGNGAMEALSRAGEFVAPDVWALEQSLEYGLGRNRGRVFVDLWDFDRIACCGDCRDVRRERLARMNLSQQIEAAVVCSECGGLD